MLYKTPGKRIAVGLGVPLSALAVLFACLCLGRTPPCLFYEITGLFCIGCGSGRALYALLHGRLASAFRYHPLLISLLPLLVYYSLKVYAAYVLDRDLLPFPTVRSRIPGIALLAILLAFGILRNIPVPPFTLLAPGGA